VGDNFEAGIFGEVEGLGNSADGVAPISVACNVFVDGLDPNFEPGAAVAEHLTGVDN